MDETGWGSDLFSQEPHMPGVAHMGFTGVKEAGWKEDGEPRKSPFKGTTGRLGEVLKSCLQCTHCSGGTRVRFLGVRLGPRTIFL